MAAYTISSPFHNMKIVIDVLLIVFGFLSYERGRAKRALRKPIRNYLGEQYRAATAQFEAEPTTQNSLAKDRCELNLLYEGQRGRPLRRLGFILVAVGVTMLFTFR